MLRHALLTLFLVASCGAAAESLSAQCAATATEGGVLACERALAENPSDDESRRNLGRAYLANGDGGRSILTYRDLLVRHPDDWTLHYDLAVASAAAMRFREAAEPALTALRMRPDDRPALKIARIALQMSGRSAEAILLLERLAADGDDTAMFDLADAYEYGLGVVADSSRAGTWYLKAGDAGHGGAAARLADAYLNGDLGLNADPALAEAWARRAKGD